MRAFIAARLDKPVTERLVQIQGLLKAPMDAVGFRPTKPEKMHLTFAFMGNLAERAVEPLHARLRERLSSLQPVTAPFKPHAVGPFGFGHQDRVMVACLEFDGEFLTLSAEIRSSLVECGVEFDLKRFWPHVTVARGRHTVRQNKWWGLAGAIDLPPIPDLKIREVVLIQSVIGSAGANYSDLFTVSLGGIRGPA
ncbi:MAG: RNA 2',3'-cyclic phosphodiesterase [Fimbriimonadaceae bacterium]|nr:RNA 2',3'-cyclic phosphodiesterase [Fimbriimonadaceae bacterium]